MDVKRKSLVIRKSKALEKKRESSKSEIEQLYNIMESKFRNEFQSMYKSLITPQSKCEHCGCGYKLQRCHAGKTRKEIGLQAIEELYSSYQGVSMLHEILIRFVSLHIDEPVKILCESCHRKFDSKPKTDVKCHTKPKTEIPGTWRIEIRTRQTGKKDKYYHSPTGRVFRSLTSAQPYF